MIGETITLTVNSVAKILTKINQDSYSAEYLLKEATGEYRMKIRHSKEKSVNGLPGLDRHNVELTRTVYATATTNQVVRQVYYVIRNPVDAVLVDVSNEAAALFAWSTSANMTKLYGWES